jgi:hypothetical protein
MDEFIIRSCTQAPQATDVSSSGRKPLFDISVKLIGENGNAFVLIGLVKQALRRHKVSSELCDKFVKDATSGDYDNVLRVCMHWVHVT